MDEHTIKLNTETRRNKEKFNNIKHIMPLNSKEKQGTSPVESSILLLREIHMAWGTTTDSLTPEINPFQYAREIKYLTLKDQNLRESVQKKGSYMTTILVQNNPK